jgi:hypothetical protein
MGKAPGGRRVSDTGAEKQTTKGARTQRECLKSENETEIVRN